MSLDCLNETTRFDNATLRSVKAAQSPIGWFIGSCVLSVSLVANGWLMAVSWGTTNIDGIFKYMVCYLAFCDALLGIVRIAGTTLHLFADASTYLHYCAVIYTLTGAVANAMFGALVPTPLQRCLLFVDVPSLSDHARQPRSIMKFCAVLFILAIAPSVGSILAPPDQCLNISFCAQLPVNALLHGVAFIPPAVSYVAAIVAVLLFIWKVKEMQTMAAGAAGANVAQSSSEVNLNRDVLAMALVQTINPVLLTAPVLIVDIAWTLGLVSDPSVYLMAEEVTQINLLLDALSTIYYIKPYRRLALNMAKRIRQIISKPNAVNQAPAVVVNVTPADPAQPNNDWRVTFRTPTPIQPLPQIEH